MGQMVTLHGVMVSQLGYQANVRLWFSLDTSELMLSLINDYYYGTTILVVTFLHYFHVLNITTIIGQS